ncbi:recombinase family protein [Ochrobactrum pseudogrignonense]|nr:recombinase family protein [Brucella pseudogrignonensis]
MLDDARAGRFDTLCAEALDRISRDQEDMAHIYKALQFRGIALHTVAEGLTDEMHIGLKGTMNALFLRDLAEKTRRGQRGRIEKGRSGGGLAYGYDVSSDGEDGAGGRCINERQAIIIRRIFAAFAGRDAQCHCDGAEPGDYSGAGRAFLGRHHHSWAPGEGTGILNNALYRGSSSESPAFHQGSNHWKASGTPKSGDGMGHKGCSPSADYRRSLMAGSQGPATGAERRHGGVRDGVWKSREARVLGLKMAPSNLYRLLTCAQCSGEFCNVGRDRYGCAEHYRRKTCGNGKTVQRRVMEAAVRDILAEIAMLITHHADALTDDEQVNADEQSRQMQRDRQQLEKIDRRLQGLMSAIEDGLYTPALKTRFQQLEDQAESLRARLQVSARMLMPAKREAGRKWNELQTLIARLQASDTEYDVLQFKRMVGTINVIPGTARRTSRFSPAWQPLNKTMK